MPNWAIGDVEVTGKRDNVLAFVQRFVDEKNGAPEGRRFFPRSFLFGDMGYTLKCISEEFGNEPETPRTVYLNVSFAWSAYSCVVSGYPQEAKDRFATLQEACREDGVAARISTTETGICFYEVITCDEKSDLNAICEDLTEYRCEECGAIQCLAPWEIPETEECAECGHIGLVLAKEDQKTQKMEVCSHGA